MRMRWWRIKRASTAGFGLFALLLQLLLSFGHLHAKELYASRGWVGSAASMVKVLSVSGQAQIPGGLPDDDCPICTSMHMAASGLLPAPPSFASPAEFSPVFRQALVEDFSLGIPRHFLFQTRAPPIV
jgi:hypothetical protein